METQAEYGKPKTTLSEYEIYCRFTQGGGFAQIHRHNVQIYHLSIHQEPFVGGERFVIHLTEDAKVFKIPTDTLNSLKSLCHIIAQRIHTHPNYELRRFITTQEIEHAYLFNKISNLLDIFPPTDRNYNELQIRKLDLAQDIQDLERTRADGAFRVTNSSSPFLLDPESRAVYDDTRTPYCFPENDDTAACFQ